MSACFYRSNFYDTHQRYPFYFDSAMTYSHYRNVTVGCYTDKRTTVKLIKSETDFQNYPLHNSIEKMIGPTDFSLFDLVVVTAGDLPMTYTSTGTPTTMGDEWMIYTGFFVGCTGSDSVSIGLKCTPDAGGAMVFYWARISKSKDQNVSCGCT